MTSARAVLGAAAGHPATPNILTTPATAGTSFCGFGVVRSPCSVVALEDAVLSTRRPCHLPFDFDIRALCALSVKSPAQLLSLRWMLPPRGFRGGGVADLVLWPTQKLPVQGCELALMSLLLLCVSLCVSLVG